VGELKVKDAATQLDPLSEMLALSTYANTKNILIIASELEGPLDEAAFMQAFQDSGNQFPQIKSCLREVRNGLRYRLVRQPLLDMPLRLKRIDLSDAGPVTGPDSFLEPLKADLDRDWDLLNEHLCWTFLIRVSQVRHIVGYVVHHAASDAATATDVAQYVFKRYHEIVTGETPEWAKTPISISTARKRPARLKKRTFRDFFRDARLAFEPFVRSAVLPAGSGRTADLEQHQIKRMCSVDDSERILGLALKSRASLVDVLVSATNIAVDRWNQARNIDPGFVTTSMTVNMKGRFKGFEKSNNSGLIFFESQPHERQDPKTFARSIALSRIGQFRRHMDLRFFHNVSKMTNSFRVIPFKKRRKIVNYFMQKHQYSIGVTLLGVVWPELENGRPTGRSGLTETGNLRIKEIHGIGYKLLSNTHLVLTVYVYRQQLNLVLAASASLFERSEAEQFMDLIVENLSDSPVG
jgi:hypothetical protein